jgi:hypothetical protein
MQGVRCEVHFVVASKKQRHFNQSSRTTSGPTHMLLSRSAFNSLSNAKGLVEYNIPMSPSLGLGYQCIISKIQRNKTLGKAAPQCGPMFLIYDANRCH